MVLESVDAMEAVEEPPKDVGVEAVGKPSEDVFK